MANLSVIIPATGIESCSTAFENNVTNGTSLEAIHTATNTKSIAFDKAEMESWLKGIDADTIKVVPGLYTTTFKNAIAEYFEGNPNKDEYVSYINDNLGRMTSFLVAYKSDTIISGDSAAFNLGTIEP